MINESCYVIIANNPFSRLRGLYFRKHDSLMLLCIYPCNDVHTLFFRHDIDIAFFDSFNVVVCAWKNLSPYRRVRCNNAFGVIERYAANDQPWFKVGDKVNYLWRK